jgi:hypothetical protein
MMEATSVAMMDGSTMIKVATILIALTAAGGVVMAGIRFMGADRPPSSIAMLHGVMAAAALTLLLYVAFTVGVTRQVQVAIGALVIAGLIGTALNLMFHVKLLKLPVALILIHGVFALAGLLLMIDVVLGLITLESGITN